MFDLRGAVFLEVFFDTLLRLIGRFPYGDCPFPVRQTTHPIAGANVFHTLHLNLRADNVASAK